MESFGLVSKQPSSPRMHFKPHSTLRNPLWTIRIGGGCFDWFHLWATIKIYRPAWTTSHLPLTASSCSVSSTDHGVLRGPICDIDSWLWSVLPRLDHVGGDLRRAMEVIATLQERKLWPTWWWAISSSCKLKKYTDLFAFFFFVVLRYIRSERSIILLNFCLSIICSNILILVGQTQTHNVVSVI